MPVHTCPHCRQSFTRKIGLIQHMRIRTGERPHSCNICPKSFNRAADLYSHRKTHSERQFICQRIAHGGTPCGKKFTRQRDLVRHYGSCRNPSQATENTAFDTFSSEAFTATEANEVMAPIQQDEELVEMEDSCWTGPSMTERKPLWGEANWDSVSNVWPVRQPEDQSCLVDARKSSIGASTHERAPDAGPQVRTSTLSRSQKTSAVRVGKMIPPERHDFMNDPLSNFWLNDSLIYDGEKCFSRALGSFWVQYTDSICMAPQSDLSSAAYLGHYGGLIESARFLMQRRNLSVAISCSSILGAVADVCAPGSRDVHYAFIYRAQKSYRGYSPDWTFLPDDIAFLSERISVVCLRASRYLSWEIRQAIDAVGVAQGLTRFVKLYIALLCVRLTFAWMKTRERARARCGSDTGPPTASSRPNIVALLSCFYDTLCYALPAVQSIAPEAVSVTAKGRLASQASLRKKLEKLEELIGGMAILWGKM